MSETQPYSKEWFEKQKHGAFKSAKIILPIVMDLVSPKSVVDVGCGVGMWLSCFQTLGVKDILGIDGDYIKLEQLHIPKENFLTIDISKPFNIDKKADLVMSLEVGEHLPDSSANSFVESITKIAPVVLFSAAIPQQPGTAHINCQWPEYWANLFKKFGYIPVDAIRRIVWTNSNVEYWYAQNTIIYVKESELSKYPRLQKEIENGFSTTLPLVHPERYRYALKPSPTIIFRIIRKLKKIFGLNS